MLVETIWEDNAGVPTPIELHRCDKCGKDLPHYAPREVYGEKDYCGDCAFLSGMIDDKQYIKNYYYWLDVSGLRAMIHEGQIYVDIGLFEWERTSRNRESKSYREWRDSVYARDDYTCQECGKKGGTLNAHHIKPYALYPKLRTNLKNGITLCVECHKKLHERKRGDDLSLREECLQSPLS